MICPMMSSPMVDTQQGGRGKIILKRVDCQQEECAWWTGEQCAVAAIAKGPKVFFGMDLAKEE